MMRTPLILAAIALAMPLATTGDAVAQGPRVTFYRQRIVIRVPRVQPATAAAEWKEKKGPSCLPAGELAGALIAGSTAVDLLMTDGRRMRARLDQDCRGANFYSGLYLKPGPDGRICADRDAFRLRSGARCRIHDFRRLTLKR